MILIYKDKATLDMVWAETPFIGTCHLRGDFPRDEHGNPIELRLTEEPYVRPAVSNDGRYAQSYPWGEEEMAEFEAYWLAQFDSGALQWWTELPPDWLPEGWQDAPPEENAREAQVDELPALKAWVPDKVQVVDKLPVGWKAKVVADALG